MAEAFGVNAARLKIIAFVYAALLACISGWLYAHLQRFVNPTPFGINQGIEYLFMAVIGGAGSVWGAVLGATLITLLKEVLQDYLPRLLGRTGNFELVVFGLLMVLLLQFAREGLWPWIERVLPKRRPRPIPGAAPLPSRGRTSESGALLAVRQARKQFGGLVAVNDLSFDIRSRRNSRAHRTERRRQEHDVCADFRGTAVDVRRHPVARRSDRQPAAVRNCPARSWPHVPARQADSDHDGGRQRGARRLSARDVGRHGGGPSP
jgi:hypothetical protein